jgi:hypothetical protein
MSLINISICLSDIPKDKIKVGKNGKKYMNFTVASRKEVSQYGETHVVFVSRTKEERESNAPTTFVGGGREYKPQPTTADDVNNFPVSENNDDLPF